MIRIRSLLVVAVLGLSFPLGCGDDEELDLSETGGSGGSQTGGGGSGNGGSAGKDSGTGATGGGTGATTGGGGGSGVGGNAGAAGADAGGCPVQGTNYQFDWCPTLMSQRDAPGKSVGIIPIYIGTIHADCRVSKLVDEHPEIAEFANELTSFTLQLWGCQGDGVTEFGLVSTGIPDAGFPNLTAADVALLIEIYVARTTLILGLGSTLEKLLFDTLNCLAAPLIKNPSTTEYSFSVCPPDAGADGDTDASADDGGTE